jgi:hypothetical protein
MPVRVRFADCYEKHQASHQQPLKNALRGHTKRDLVIPGELRKRAGELDGNGLGDLEVKTLDRVDARRVI